METEFLLNQSSVKESCSPALLLLDYLRNSQGLSATKEGCKEGDCGACTVLVGEMREGRLIYQPQTSCLIPIGSLKGKHVVTLEGLKLEKLNPVQQALYEEGGSQCGYCTPGFVVSLMWYLLEGKDLSLKGWKEAIGGNLCRCTGYGSIKRSGEKIISLFQTRFSHIWQEKNRIPLLVENGFLPAYFLDIPSKLSALSSSEAMHHSIYEQKPDHFLAGGTDLFVQQGDDLLEKEVFLLTEKPDLKGISKEGNFLKVGSMTSFWEFENHPEVQKLIPKIKDYMSLVASIPIRTRATLGGNLGNASPIGDLSIILLALEAELELHKEDQIRRISLKEFFLDYKKLALQENEIIAFIWIPLFSPKTLFHFEKVSKRKHLDIASVNSAAKIEVTEQNMIQKAAISVGGVAPIPLFLSKTSAFLVGKPLDIEVLNLALETLQEEISPISDIRGSKEYKSLLAKNLFLAHFISLFPEQAVKEILFK
ncbi:MAG: (2Fe-2S)-binding protein [Planctomycetota bacterium]|nr:MAG: (2Fe-2S)-binding protein [Planctomycetota bacterium]